MHQSPPPPQRHERHAHRTLHGSRGATCAPAGHVGFCSENPSECRSQNRNAVVVKLRPGAVERAARGQRGGEPPDPPVTDVELFGVEEYWTFPSSGAGDCEEYVLRKQRVLQKRGWPKSALLITVVKDTNNSGHAVLTVRTDQGDIILDNQIEAVLPWYSTPYRFVKRQSARNPAKWADNQRPSGQHGCQPLQLTHQTPTFWQSGLSPPHTQVGLSGRLRDRPIFRPVFQSAGLQSGSRVRPARNLCQLRT
ncbi:MAG: transglutaminase-like cysteine peptidase [Alphaproteobacteria bacterium]|nr:transglutaminase-like cysteine peptidase [Alphaproteobacteria bacterium]